MYLEIVSTLQLLVMIIFLLIFIEPEPKPIDKNVHRMMYS